MSDHATPVILERQRVRFTYAKGEAVKFISHHDEFRLWERTLRRADLPLLYKQGFNPQPHIQFASPLGVGITGAGEWVDIVFSPPVPLAELAERIRASLPPGVELHEVREVPLKAPSVQSRLIGADYTILLYAGPGEIPTQLLADRIRGFWETAVIWRERERKGRPYRYNLRPLILELSYRGYDADEEAHHIFLRVQQREGATGRPDEVVDAMGLDDFARTLRRDRLYLADVAEDAALFAAYPVIDQESITHPEDLKQRRDRQRRYRRRQESAAARRARQQSFAEKAGDEFD